jgi:hypothetical protein
MRGENLPIIFGLKLRQHREAKGYGLKELSERVGLSPSYLNEIENGKKYPKVDKILQIAQALEVPYDDLVSAKLGQEFEGLEGFLDSPIIQALPLKFIGLAPRDVIELITRAPQEVSALLNTLAEIARDYDMHVEHFFHAMLRSYQQTHDNYFEDIEAAATALRQGHRWKPGTPVTLGQVSAVLQEELGVTVDDERLERYPDLAGFRSVWMAGPPERLLLNGRLSERQKVFQIAREIGYRDLKLKARGTTSSRAEVESFEQVLNDFKASYYAGALMIDQDALVQDLKALFGKERWDGSRFLVVMQRYGVTPEMFLYRLTQVLPKRFGLHQQHFLRVTHDAETHGFHVTKELNMSGLLIPTGLGGHEHYCRRWVAISLLQRMEEQQRRGPVKGPLIAVQRSRFISMGEEHFRIALARPLALSQGSSSCVTLGFPLDETFKQTVRFWDDPAVPHVDVNVTCERCGLSRQECGDRAAPPMLYEQQQALEARNQALEQLFADRKAEGKAEPKTEGKPEPKAAAKG